MSLWGKNNNANSAPKWKGTIVSPRAYGASARGNTAFSNTTGSAFTNNEATGVFLYNSTGPITYKGWELITAGATPT